MKKVHSAAWGWGYHFPDEAVCGVPWHEGKRRKITQDYEKVTCLKCRKLLGLDQGVAALQGGA